MGAGIPANRIRDKIPKARRTRSTVIRHTGCRNRVTWAIRARTIRTRHRNIPRRLKASRTGRQRPPPTVSRIRPNRPRPSTLITHRRLINKVATHKQRRLRRHNNTAPIPRLRTTRRNKASHPPSRRATQHTPKLVHTLRRALLIRQLNRRPTRRQDDRREYSNPNIPSHLAPRNRACRSGNKLVPSLRSTTRSRPLSPMFRPSLRLTFLRLTFLRHTFLRHPSRQGTVRRAFPSAAASPDSTARQPDGPCRSPVSIHGPPTSPIHVRSTLPVVTLAMRQRATHALGSIRRLAFRLRANPSANPKFGSQRSPLILPPAVRQAVVAQRTPVTRATMSRT